MWVRKFLLIKQMVGNDYTTKIQVTLCDKQIYLIINKTIDRM